MPQILVITDGSEEDARTIVYRERIVLSDFESTHFTGQLAERVGWAVSDASRLEKSGLALPPSQTDRAFAAQA